MNFQYYKVLLQERIKWSTILQEQLQEEKDIKSKIELTKKNIQGITDTIYDLENDIKEENTNE